MDHNYKRVNIMILEEQYQHLTEAGLNISGLIRDLLGDYLSGSKITVQVTEETRKLYDLIVSNTGATDQDVEVHLRRALASVLEDRIEQMRDLHTELMKEVDEADHPSASDDPV